MQTVLFDTPGLYGDHHVLEIRKELSNQLRGISGINASSAFRGVEVTFDENLTSESQIQLLLKQMGYLDEISAPEINSGADSPFTAFRHMVTYSTVQGTMSFQQDVPIHNQVCTCPGLGTFQNCQ